MKNRKTICLFLALLLLLPSCSTDTPEEILNTETEIITETIETEPETEATLNLPEELDLEGKTISMLVKEEDSIGNVEGDELAVAAYTAQINAEELLNAKYEFQISSVVPIEISNLVHAGEDAYAAAAHSGRWYASFFLDGIFHDIKNLEYIDLDKPWWYKDYIESVSVNINNPNILVSDMTWYPIGLLQGILINDRLMNQYLQISNNDLYQIVLDGKWTTDKFLSFTENVYTDVNGNGQYDDTDIYPWMNEAHYSITPLVYGSGISMESRDKDGYPVLAINNELVYNQVEKLFNFFKSDTCLYTNDNITQKNFSAGTVLMIKIRLADTFWYLREMEDDYCIVPLPKYDESIANYTSFPEGGIQWYGVPITVSDTAAVSAAIEALSYFGHQFIKPTVIEQSLKKKYTRDDMSSQVIDIMIEHSTASFFYAFEKSGRIGKMPELFENLFNENNNSNNFASLVAAYEPSTVAALKELKSQE